MKRQRPTTIVTLVAIVLTALSAFAAGRKGFDPVSPGDKAKSDYTYLEAVNQKLKGNNDAYIDLLSRAYELNPTDTSMMFEYGYFCGYLMNEDSVNYARFRDYMKKGVDADPGDYMYGFAYASLLARDNPAEALRVMRRIHELYPQRPDFTYRYANLLSAGGDSLGLRKAVAVLDTLEKTQGIDAGITSNKLQVLFNLRDTTAMVSEINRLLQAAPASVENNILAGELYSEIHRPDTAIYYYNRACELDSTSGEAFYSRANYYRHAGDSVAYDREVFNALGKTSLDLNVKMVLMRDYVSALFSDSLQQPRIETLFQRLIVEHPHEADIHDLYASYLIARKDYAGAAEQTSYQLDLAPDNEKGWLRLCALYEVTDRYRQSIDAARRGLKYFPESSDLMLTIGNDYTHLKEYPEAFEYMRKALSLADSTKAEPRAQIITAIGDTYYNMELPDSAFACYEQALKLAPDNAMTLNNYAYFLAVKGQDLSHARQMIERALLSSPDEPTWLDTYAWVLFRQKDFTRAKEIIDRTLEKTVEQPSAEIYEHAGDIYFMNGEPDGAVDFWKEALKLDPGNELLARKVKHKTYFYK